VASSRGRGRLAVAAWCLYDFANSSYTTLIITVVFSVYFREAVVNATDNSADRLWGLANFIAMLVIVLTAPLLGAIADFSGRRKRFLILTTLLTVSATALLYFVDPGEIALAMSLYIIATIGFEGGYIFYNAFLPDVSTPRTIHRVSALAWAVGYVGGLVALLAVSPLTATELHRPDGGFHSEAIAGRQLSFLLVAAFFLLFALPAFLFLRESTPQGGQRSWLGYASAGFGRVRDTVKQLRRHQETAKFVVASLFFTDGITTVIGFSAIYATTTFGFTSGEIIVLFLVLNVIAFPGSLLGGVLADRIGAKKTIIVTLLLWVGVVLLGAAAQGKTMFYVMAAGAAIGMGSTQAVGRSFMAQISPPNREAEFFGFYVLSGKFASMFGPLLFGLISAATGSQRLAVLSLLPFFVVGLLLMFWIDETRARADSRQPG